MEQLVTLVVGFSIILALLYYLIPKQYHEDYQEWVTDKHGPKVERSFLLLCVLNGILVGLWITNPDQFPALEIVAPALTIFTMGITLLDNFWFWFTTYRHRPKS